MFQSHLVLLSNLALGGVAFCCELEAPQCAITSTQAAAHCTMWTPRAADFPKYFCTKVAVVPQCAITRIMCLGGGTHRSKYFPHRFHLKHGSKKYCISFALYKMNIQNVFKTHNLWSHLQLRNHQQTIKNRNAMHDNTNVSWAKETLKAAEKEDMNAVHLWSVWFLPWSLDRNASIAVGW